MRTKEEIIRILAKANFPDVINASTWSDLVASITAYSPEQKQSFVNLIVKGKTKKAGEMLKRALYENAQGRAQADVEQKLSDDSLSLEEIDAIL